MSPSELKTLRERLRISLLELSAMTGLPESYLEQIEAGSIPPTPSALKRMEKALMTMKKM